MPKRRKTIRAGRLVYDIAYTVPRPNATKQERGRIREVTAEQIARTNCNTAQRKLELLMAANFEPEDLLISPTYRDDDLSGSVEVTRRRRAGIISTVKDVTTAPKVWGIPMLIQVKQWYRNVYSIKNCASVEEMRWYLG